MRVLLAGERFIDAVADARSVAYAYEGNTWAAYQCYGDPDWRLRRDGAETSSEPPEHEFEGVTSVAMLKLALETLLVQKTYQGYESSYQLKRVAHARSALARGEVECLRRRRRALRARTRRGGEPRRGDRLVRRGDRRRRRQRLAPGARAAKPTCRCVGRGARSKRRGHERRHANGRRKRAQIGVRHRARSALKAARETIARRAEVLGRAHEIPSHGRAGQPLRVGDEAARARRGRRRDDRARSSRPSKR